MGNEYFSSAFFLYRGQMTMNYISVVLRYYLPTSLVNYFI